jgi:hypothetical protein
VDQLSSSTGEPVREERVRALGIDPRHLSPEEQVELIDMHSACPDDRLEGDAGMEM